MDAESGLIVRRETHDVDGRPVRVVAFTELEVDPATGLLTPPDVTGEVERVSLAPVERRALLADGIPAHERLPGGFELLGASQVEPPDRRPRPIHLVYGDGLYTLSLYVQRGRLARARDRRRDRSAAPGRRVGLAVAGLRTSAGGVER